MTDELKNRERKVNVENLDSEQAALIGEELGKKLGEIAEEAVQKANKLAKIYGLEAKMAFQLIDMKTGNSLT